MKKNTELCPNIFCSKRDICLSIKSNWWLSCGLRKEFINTLEFHQKGKKRSA